MPRRNNQAAPMIGGSVTLRNGMVGEIIGINGDGYYSKLEVMIQGTRCYVDAGDVRINSVLDMIVQALDKDDRANGKS
jgi:hypothetical protein